MSEKHPVNAQVVYANLILIEVIAIYLNQKINPLNK